MSIVLHQQTHLFDRDPDHCPICHRGIEPVPRDERAVHVDGPRERVEQVFQCPSLECRRLFIAYYVLDHSRVGEPGWDRLAPTLRLAGCLPMSPAPSKVPPTISAISPSFVKILEQAQSAEAYGLDQVAGGGYRKALEFLVKDFCIHVQGEKERPRIEGMKLMACIDAFIDDARAKECARRAAWLGNDELHFVRLFGERDIEDLKRLIHLLTNWIDNALVTARYLEEMPKGRRRPAGEEPSPAPDGA